MDELRNINITIDGIEISVPQGSTVLQACEAAGAKFQDFVIMKNYPWQAIVGCVWSKWKDLQNL